MLAAGWRTLYHVSTRIYQESGNGEAQRGDVPHASLRRADDWNALANAETWRGAFSAGAGRESGRAHPRSSGDRRRAGDGAVRHAADSAGPRRNDVRWLLAARARGDGDLRDE